MVEGELVMSPAPNRFHQDVVLNESFSTPLLPELTISVAELFKR